MKAIMTDIYDINRIQQMIPHRPPMLLIDRVVDVVLDTSCVGIKNVTINEPFFVGHYPGHPIMPGVLLIEAIAQTSAVLVVATLGPESEGKLAYFMTIDEARFRRPIVPGDQLRIHVKKERQVRNVWKFSGQVMVDGQLCAEAIVASMVRDRE
jgi:3-hydroxyacyl-[acyl-carrier-protein] dehydratase